jgi:hypothetical protein
VSAQRAYRLSRTFAVAGIICLVADRNFTFNGLDMVTIMFAVGSVALLIKAKGN